MLKLKTVITPLLFLGLVAVAGFIEAAAPIKMEKVAVSKYPKDMIIGNMGYVTVDAKGNVFAFTTSGKDCSVIKFSQNLDYITQFGRNGRGPAEFSRFGPGNRISIDEDGNVHVSDSNPTRIIIFDNNGNYTKKEFMFSRLGFLSVGCPRWIGKGKYIAFSYNPKTNGSEGVLVTIDPPGLKSLYAFKEKRIVDEDGVHWVGLYWGGDELIDSDTEHFVFANASVFRFLVFDKNGKLIVKVEDPKRVENSFSNKEMDNLEEENSHSSQDGRDWFKRHRSQIRDHKNVIHNVKISGDRVYVFTVEDITITDSFPVEIYNLKGQLIKKGTMPARPDRIWKNYAYFLSRDEEDNPLITKYKILE
jgi:hypothetical protein